eukprot:jgi/Botrbrau1/14361/Bobra.0014s0016.1
MGCTNDSSYATTNYGAELAILTSLQQSSFVTRDPLQADFFFVPAQLYCMQAFGGYADHRNAAEQVLMYIRRQFPYWDARGGSDHIWLFTHDHGFCGFKTNDGTPPQIRSSIILSHWGLKHKEVPCGLDDYIHRGGCPVRRHEDLHGTEAPCFVPGKDIVIASAAFDGIPMGAKEPTEGLEFNDKPGPTVAPSASAAQRRGSRPRMLFTQNSSAPDVSVPSGDHDRPMFQPPLPAPDASSTDAAVYNVENFDKRRSLDVAPNHTNISGSVSPTVDQERGQHVPVSHLPNHGGLASGESTFMGDSMSVGTKSGETSYMKGFDGKRNLLFFAGDVRPYDPGYSHGVRQALFKMFANQTGFALYDSSKRPLEFSEMLAMMDQSLFCLAATGAGWGVRLKLAAMMRCIPLIIADGVEFEYEDILPYPEFSVRIPQHFMPGLPDILRSLIEDEPALVKKMQKRLNCVWMFFSWRPTWGKAMEAFLCSIRQRLPGGQSIQPVLDYDNCRLHCGSALGSGVRA